MGIIDTFAKRKRRAEKGSQDVYQYHELPSAFRVQVVHIWGEGLGDSPTTDGWWQEIHDVIAKESGVFHLGNRFAPSLQRCQEYVLNAKTDDALSLIEVSFRVMEGFHQNFQGRAKEMLGLRADAEEAIAELNERFREHAIGYQYVDRQIIRVDSQYVHAEAVVPALRLLHDKKFRGASEEFMKAHEHYRHGRNKEAATEALKAMESTLKTICKARGWSLDPHRDTVIKLLEIVFREGLIPAYLQGQFSSLRAVLEGLATVRNKTSGHGQGAAPTPLPDYLAAYALHSAASNIVLLIEAFDALR